MYLTYLLFDIRAVRLLQPDSIATVKTSVITVNGSLLPARSFLFSDRLPSHRIEDVSPLTGKALEIIGDVGGG